MLVTIDMKKYKKNVENGGCPCKMNTPCPCLECLQELQEKGQCYCGLIKHAKWEEDQLEWLAALEDAGVDNWTGIDYAHEVLEEWKQQEE